MGDRRQAHEFAEALEPGGIDRYNAEFREQREALNLLYTCRHCAHLNEQTKLCSLEYPNDELWEADKQGWALNSKGDIVFCKYFEVD